MATSLSIKLNIGFALSGSITLAVGLLGCWGIAGLKFQLEKTDRIQEVAKTFLQREIDHLNWVRKVGEFQRDPSMLHLEVQKDPHQCGLGQWYYGEGRLLTERLMPDLQPWLAKLETPHIELHRSAVRLEALLAQGAAGRQKALDCYRDETTLALRSIQSILGEIRPKVEGFAQNQVAQARHRGTIVGRIAASTTAFGLLIAAVFGFFFGKMISRPIVAATKRFSEGTSQITLAASQVSISSQALASGASQQAAALEQSSASLEELSSITQRNASTAQNVNELVRKVRTVAERGTGDMEVMSSSMSAIKDSSDDIRKIIRTIDEIAFQTNILALNAAVEAARAGEAGMGFAVVADEVRTLAQRSAQAARETSAKIEGAIARTSAGVESSAKVATALNEILHDVRQVDTLAGEVANASQEQALGIKQINQAVAQIDQVTQSNAAAAEQSAAASQELHAQASSMRSTVCQLVNLVGGNQVTPIESSSPLSQPTDRKNPRLSASVRSNGQNAAEEWSLAH